MTEERTKTALQGLIEMKLGTPGEPVDIYDWLGAQRHAGKTLQEIAYEIKRRTNVGVTPETIRQWARQLPTSASEKG